MRLTITNDPTYKNQDNYFSKNTLDSRDPDKSGSYKNDCGFIAFVSKVP